MGSGDNVSVVNLLTQPAVLQRFVPTDTPGPLNQPNYDIVPVDTTCYLQLLNQSADAAVAQVGRKEVIFLPADTDMTDVRVITVADIEWRVDGQPHKQWNPRLRRCEYVSVPLVYSGPFSNGGA